MAAKSTTGNTVTMYRLGDHVDMTQGPLISSTAFINRFSVAAVSTDKLIETGILVTYSIQSLVHDPRCITSYKEAFP